MKSGIYLVQTDEERKSIYELRYDIYVEEMNRYRSIADHDNRQLIEPDDENSRLYFAVEDGKVVGTMRLTWGRDAPFTPRLKDQYDLAPFLSEVSAEQMIIGERFMVRKAYRGTDLLFRMFCTYMEFVNEQRIQLVFGDCEPHLLNIFQKLGFRAYTKKNVNNPDAGFLIPLVIIPEDIAYMKMVGSPLLAVLQDFGSDSRVPDCVPRMVAKGSGVMSQQLVSQGEYWIHVYDTLSHLEQNQFSLFDDLTEEQIQETLNKSNIIECRKGDRILKKGNVAKNMFIVLSGVLEVRDDKHVVALLTEGDVFGEMAFLLRNPRSRDVYAATDDVQILSLSESTVRKMIESNPEIAAKMLLNISKMLCVRILKTTH